MAQSKSLGACLTLTNWNVLVLFFFLFSVTRFKTRMCQPSNFLLVYKIPFEDKFTEGNFVHGERFRRFDLFVNLIFHLSTLDTLALNHPN